MNITSPDGIAYATTGDNLSIEDITAAMATSIQDAFDDKVNDTRQIQTFRWADSTARGAQTGMIAGDRGYQTDTAVEYIYNGSAWVTYPLDTGWINATYSGAWGTSSSMPVRYRRRNGVVYVEGEATGGSAASTIFNLPAGYRPTTQLKRMAVNADGTAYYRAIIATGGNVSVSNAGSSATPNLAFSFIADQ